MRAHSPVATWIHALGKERLNSLKIVNNKVAQMLEMICESFMPRQCRLRQTIGVGACNRRFSTYDPHATPRRAGSEVGLAV